MCKQEFVQIKDFRSCFAIDIRMLKGCCNLCCLTGSPRFFAILMSLLNHRTAEVRSVPAQSGSVQGDRETRAVERTELRRTTG